MSNRARLGVEALALVLLFAAFGCGSSDPIVLRVGSEEIPLSTFETSFWEVTSRDTTIPRDTSGVNSFLETYIEKELMEHVAAQYIPEFDEAMLDNLEGQREDMMHRLLNQAVYGDAMSSSEEELRHAYEKLKTQFHLREIRVSSQETADRIAGMIRDGGVFGKIAARETENTRAQATEGDIGWVTLGQIPLPVYDAAAQLSTGEVSPPIRSSMGFHLIMLEDSRETEEVMTFEEARPTLETTLTREKVTKAVVAYNEELIQRYRYEVLPENVIWATNWLRDATAGLTRGTEGLEDEGQTSGLEVLSDMDPEDQQRILATSTADTLNVLLLMAELTTLPAAAWPTFDSPEDALKILRNLMLVRLRLADARRRQLDQDPALLWQLQKKRDVILARQFFLRHVRPPVEPTEDDLRAYYDDYVQRAEDQRRYLAIHTADESAAADVSRRLREGEPPETVYQSALERDSTTIWTGEEGTRFYSRGELPGLGDVLFSLSVGEVSEPVPLEDRYSVLKLLGTRKPPLLSFERVKSDIKTGIWRNRSDLRLGEMLQGARDTVDIHVDRDALGKMRLAPPDGWKSARQIIYGRETAQRTGEEV